MAEHAHTFHYDTEAELIAQMQALTNKLLARDMRPLKLVMADYPHLSAAMFYNRLIRFKGSFPHVRSPSGRYILRMLVTPELHAYLSHPSGKGRKFQ